MDPGLIIFVAMLEIIVRAVGGRLTYAKPDKGSLIEVFAVLRLCPEGDWLPKHPSVRAILTARSLAQGGLRAIDKWLSKLESAHPVASLIADKTIRELRKNKKLSKEYLVV